MELLNKYFEGKTSSAEEQELRYLFASDRVSDELKVYKPLFAYLDEEIEMLKPIEKTGAKSISFSKRKILYTISVAAACALIFLSIGLFNLQKEQPCIANGNYAIVNGRCYSDAELIKSMAFQALSEVSVPVDAYLADKEMMSQKEVMSGQLKELSNMFD